MIKSVFTAIICLGILFSVQMTYAQEELPLPEGKNIKEWESISAALVAEKRFKDPDLVQFCNYNPFLGIIPIEISDVFPASHYVMSRKEFEPEKFPTFLEVWNRFFDKNDFDAVYLPKDDSFLQYFKKFIPKGITKRQIIE